MNETSQADRYAPLFAELDRRLAGESPVRLAIEGGSASGKTTLGKILTERYGCTVFHMDDFFLRSEQRTAARFAEPGGNVDRERFLAEVLLPLRRGEIRDADHKAHASSSGAMCALSQACNSARPSSDIGNVRSSSISLFS